MADTCDASGLFCFTTGASILERAAQVGEARTRRSLSVESVQQTSIFINACLCDVWACQPALVVLVYISFCSVAATLHKSWKRKRAFVGYFLLGMVGYSWSKRASVPSPYCFLAHCSFSAFPTVWVSVRWRGQVAMQYYHVMLAQSKAFPTDSTPGPIYRCGKHCTGSPFAMGRSVCTVRWGLRRLRSLTLSIARLYCDWLPGGSASKAARAASGRRMTSGPIT